MSSCVCHFFLCCRCCSCISGCSHNGTIIFSSALQAPWRQLFLFILVMRIHHKFQSPLPPLPMECHQSNPSWHSLIHTHVTLFVPLPCSIVPKRKVSSKSLCYVPPLDVLFLLQFRKKESKKRKAKKGKNANLAMTWLGGALQTSHMQPMASSEEILRFMLFL